MKSKKINVIGLGYIGLPTAAILASNGFHINGVDVNKKVVDIVNQGKIHIIEPDLENIVQKCVSQGLLKASVNPVIADIHIICVPTPFKGSLESPKPDISFIIKSAEELIKVVKRGDLIILESTSPVGTTDLLFDFFNQKGIYGLHVAHCPERVLPGDIIRELVENDRIVGGVDSESTNIAARFYREFVSGNVIETNSKTAELCKLTENSFRDVNIAFANELSLICDKEKINVWELIKYANRHPRVNILNPGVGVGGHCIAVDPWFIIDRDPKNSRLIKTARNVNVYKKDWAINKIVGYRDKLEKKYGVYPKVICYGISFKPNIDDLRESPALDIAKDLSQKYKNTSIIDPNIKSLEGIDIIDMKTDFSPNCIHVFLVKHSEFCTPSFKERYLGLEVIDFCGVFEE